MVPSNDPSSQVGETFDRIAHHFDQTRSTPWPDVTSFLETAEPGELGLDLGCGNGRHSIPMAEKFDTVVGIDLSIELLHIAREKSRRNRSGGNHFIRGSSTMIPLSKNRVDLGLYIATIHHIADPEERLASLMELHRVLKPAGRALISTWSTTHERFEREESFETVVDWMLPDETTVPRYYYIYSPRDFWKVLEATPFQIEKRFQSHGNCYGIVSKPRK